MSTNRRRFLKYIAAGGAVIGASAFGFEYLLGTKPASQTQTPISTSTRTVPILKQYDWSLAEGSIHDGSVTISVEDPDSVIASAQLDFEPVFPPEFPKDAFPAETSKTYTLQTNRTDTDSSFAQPVNDLKGGKTYQAKTGFKDQAGNLVQVDEPSGVAGVVFPRDTISLDIPYVRQFDNIGKTNKIKLGTHYYALYGGPNIGWPDAKPAQTPLLGLYDSSEQMVTSRHADLARPAGRHVARNTCFSDMTWLISS
jgi:hypothetical protein